MSLSQFRLCFLQMQWTIDIPFNRKVLGYSCAGWDSFCNHFKSGIIGEYR